MLTNINLIGNRVLILLDKEPEHTTTSSGLLIPQFTYEETDGGKLKAKASDLTYLSQGTVVSISTYAKDLLSRENTDLNVGDRVYVSTNAVSPQYQFFLDRSTKILSFDGYIAIPTSLIEAIIKDEK